MPLAILVVALLSAAPAPEAQPSSTPNPAARATDAPHATRRISGLTEPELIPDARAWDGFFAFVDSVTEGRTDPADPLVKHVLFDLHLSPADTGVLLDVTSRVRAKLAAADSLDGHELVSEGGPRLSEPGGARALLQQMDDAVLVARDELLRRVSPRGVKVLRHFIAARVKPGMTATVSE